MSDQLGRLIRMVNEIAQGLRMTGANADANVAAHLRAFWTPKMRARLIAYAQSGGEGLDETAQRAINRL